MLMKRIQTDLTSTLRHRATRSIGSPSVTVLPHLNDLDIYFLVKIIGLKVRIASYWISWGALMASY